MFDEDGMFYDPTFDFDNDGKLDSFEQIMALETISSPAYDDYDDKGDIFDLQLDLKLAGIDVDDLDSLDHETITDLIDSAGLDEDDYDFY